MTYAETITAGSGTIEYFVRFDGCKYYLHTSGNTVAGEYTSLPGLQRDSLQWSCSAYPGEVWPEVKSMDLIFVDKDGTLKTYLKGIEGLNVTELTATITTSSTQIDVVSTSGFASSGDIYLGLETIGYAAKTATAFTNLTRDKYNSKKMEHIYDQTLTPPCIPEVTDGPVDLKGRRCEIYAAEILSDDSVEGPTWSLIWRGYVDGYISFGIDTVHIPISHNINAFSQGIVASWMPSSKLNGLYIPNIDGARWGQIGVWDDVDGGDTVDVVADGTIEYFDSAADLWEATMDAWQAATPTDWVLEKDSAGYVSIYKLPTGATATTIDYSSSILELLGFRGEDLIQPFALAWKASELPSECFISFDWTAVEELRAYLEEDKATHFVESFVTFSDGRSKSPSIKVLDIDTTNDYLVLSNDLWAGDGTGDWNHAAHSPTAISVTQSWGLDDFRTHEAVRQLYAGEMYSGATTIDYTVPERWLAAPHLKDDDVDWAQLKALVESSPADTQSIEYFITEPTQISELLTGNLLGLGIYAYVKRDGSIGWRRCAIPAVEEATTSLTSAWIDGSRVSEITTELGRDRIINLVKFVFEDHIDGFRNTLFIVENRSIQRYGGKLARNILDPVSNLSDKAPEIKFWVDGLRANIDFAQEFSRHFASTVFDFHAKPRPYARIPVTPQARNLEIGEPVLLTCDWVFDRTNGVMGVTNQLAMVVGFEQTEETGKRTDWVTVLLCQEEYAAIAPSILATSYAANVFTIADDSLYHRDDDDSDFDFFEDGDVIMGYEEDSASPDKFTATISSIDTGAGTITTTGAPVGTVTTPCVIRFGDYADCTATQQGEYWCWLAHATDGLIDNLRVGYRWA